MTYDYGCKNCEYQFEVEQSIKDDPLVECPKCLQHKLQRLVSVSSFHLKGGGWAADNYTKK
jgi:putative FmdB family regulatory protein